MIRQTQIGLMFPEQFHAETVNGAEERELQFFENLSRRFAAHPVQEGRSDSALEFRCRVVGVRHHYESRQQIGSSLQRHGYDPFDDSTRFSRSGAGDNGKVSVDLAAKPISGVLIWICPGLLHGAGK